MAPTVLIYNLKLMLEKFHSYKYNLEIALFNENIKLKRVKL